MFLGDPAVANSNNCRRACHASFVQAHRNVDAIAIDIIAFYDHMQSLPLSRNQGPGAMTFRLAFLPPWLELITKALIVNFPSSDGLISTKQRHSR